MINDAMFADLSGARVYGGEGLTSTLSDKVQRVIVFVLLLFDL